MIWLRAYASFFNKRNIGSDVKENEERLRPSDNISLSLISKLGMLRTNQVQKFCVKHSTYFLYNLQLVKISEFNFVKPKDIFSST